MDYGEALEGRFEDRSEKVGFHRRGNRAKGVTTIGSKVSRSVPFWSFRSHPFLRRPRRCRPTRFVLTSFAGGPGGAAIPDSFSPLSPAAPAVPPYPTRRPYFDMTVSLKIAAVFATMNRENTALACVHALALQTRPPDLVVVADNVSSDTTVSTLRALYNLPFELRVINMGENLGNAGGVEAAMELAFQNKVDAVWILDDDSLPCPSALAALLDGAWNPEVVRHALQIDPRSKRLTWPQWIPNGGAWKLVHSPDELPEAATFPSRSSWTGALISKEVRNRVGPVNGELFIRGEDEEYPWRIGRAGFCFECVRGAVLNHPGPGNLVHWELFGRNFFIERHLVDWKLYYKIRNMVWLKRQQAGKPAAIIMAAAYAMALFRIEGSHRLGLIYRASVDGWRGKLGRWKDH